MFSNLFYQLFDTQMEIPIDYWIKLMNARSITNPFREHKAKSRPVYLFRVYVM